MEEAVTLGWLSLFFGAAPSAGLKASAKRYRFANLYKMRVETLMNDRSGRSTAQLAGLLGPTALRALVCRCAALLRQLSLRALRALLDPKGLGADYFFAQKNVFYGLLRTNKSTYVSI
ncbi:hypothetical protein SGRA_4032 [Saprospira grandis str. Lewin]|uniref:Uncharacterized protein n=1 Tax=Saprospira grandis (strain Lewin) TaxID=984262 RepID=H6L8M2_SAPGL|nr:hypothetical protein SGRA_4032 [Saprospira grandis str. Lewin]